MTTIFGVSSRRERRRAAQIAADLRSALALPAVQNSPLLFQLRRNGMTGIAVREFSHACLIRLVDYPEMPLRTNAGEVVKVGQTALIVRTELPVGERSVPVAYKRVRRDGWWKRALGLVRTNHCLRNFRLGMELQKRGVPTARPLVAIVPDRLRFASDSYLATEWIEGAVHCYAWLQRLEKTPGSAREQELKASATKLGECLGRMHAARVAHRDLKPGNLLVRRAADGPEVFIVDLDGASLRRQVGKSLRARNVSRFAVSLTAHFPIVRRSHFVKGLLSYMRALGIPESEWKAEWRRIAAMVRRRAKHGSMR